MCTTGKQKEPTSFTIRMWIKPFKDAPDEQPLFRDGDPEYTSHTFLINKDNKL